MIAAYNKKQTYLGSLSLLASVLILLCSCAFFYFAFLFMLTTFELATTNSKLISAGLMIAVMIALIFNASIAHQAGIGNYSYQESDLFMGLDYSDPGTSSLNQAIVVSGFSHLVTQALLLGPLLWIQGRKRLNSMIPDDPILEQNLQALLDEINSTGKWLALKPFQDRSREITYLIQMRAIDFSPRKALVHRK